MIRILYGLIELDCAFDKEATSRLMHTHGFETYFHPILCEGQIQQRHVENEFLCLTIRLVTLKR